MPAQFRVPEEFLNDSLATPYLVEEEDPSWMDRFDRFYGYFVRRVLGLPSKWKLVRELMAQDLEARFQDRDAVLNALQQYSPTHGGEEARQRLDAVKKRCAEVDVREAYEVFLRKCGEDPEQIVKWVRSITLHIDGAPAVMAADGRERSFHPLETLFTGIGQCTGFAVLAAALIEAAGYESRLWGVPGHTFLEWRSKNGRWQLEDADLFPPDVSLPRGLSMQSLLESYEHWGPILDAVPTMNFMAPSTCYIPTEEAKLVGWQFAAEDPDRYVYQLAFDVGGLQHQRREMKVRLPADRSERGLLVDNPNPRDLMLLICDRPFADGEARKLDEKGKQHDVFRFAKARGYYEEHLAESKTKLYARIPAGATGFFVPLDGIDADDVSVFSLFLGTVWTEPYLISASLPVPPVAPAPVVSLSDAPLPPVLEAAGEAFERLTRGDDQDVNTAAAGYARNNSVRRAMSLISELDLPPIKGRVLDAGCGTGEYAICLSHQADSVAAIDYTEGRVELLNKVLDQTVPRPAVEASVGSIEDLPHGDGEFDAVFCRGVIFITNLPKTLSEFYRVLKPGGLVYFDCNADGWNQYLVHDRKGDAARQGRDTLYNTAWRRFSDEALPALKKSIDEHELKVDLNSEPQKLSNLLEELDRHLRAMPPEDRVKVRRLELEARRLCGDQHLAIILTDLLSVAAGQQAGPTVTVSSAAWQPEEVATVLADIGFVGFEWWSEAGSRGQPGLRPLEIGPQKTPGPDTPRGHFRGDLSVWHSLFQKPDE